MLFEISGTRIAQGDKHEMARLLFLANTPAFKILARKQGYEINDLNDLESVYNANKLGQNKFNFEEIFRLIPIKSTNILAGRGRFKIVK